MVQHEMEIIMVGHYFPSVYLMSSHVTKSPSPPPLYLHATSNQILEAETAWEQG